MSLNQLKAADTAVCEILSCAQQLVDGAKRAAQQGDSFDSLERSTWSAVRQIGFAALELFIHLQGQGDLGSTVQTAEGQRLHRSEEPAACVIRSIFGRHAFPQYTYSPGANKAIALRPIDARMSLPGARCSYLLQEFSQLFCVEQAFGLAAQNMGTVFGGMFSVDTLESVNAQNRTIGGRRETVEASGHSFRIIVIVHLSKAIPRRLFLHGRSPPSVRR